MKGPYPGPPTEPMYPEQSVHAHAGVSVGQTVVTPAKHYSPLIPWVEFVAGCFGFHGIGYLLIGKPVRGIIWLVISLVKHAVGAALSVATLGLALGCIVPLNIAIGFFLAMHERQIIHRAAHPTLAKTA